MIDLKTILNLLHLIGLTVGLGAAIILDFYLLKQFHGGVIQKTAVDLTHWLSRFVVFGFAVLIASGAGFCIYYYFNAPNLLSNPKLHAKLTIILILVANSFVLHTRVLPIFYSCVGRNIFNYISARETALLVASASISFTGWWWAFTLGAVRELNFSKPYYIFMAGFILNVFIILFATAIAQKKFSSYLGRRACDVPPHAFPCTGTMSSNR